MNHSKSPNPLHDTRAAATRAAPRGSDRAATRNPTVTRFSRRRRRAVIPGKQSAKDCHEYVMWDAAYVLGSLSANDRREFEAHLAGCTLCRRAVAELTGMPTLLSRLNREEVAAIVESSDRIGNFAAAAPIR